MNATNNAIRSESLLHFPADSAEWDKAGQVLIQSQDIPLACQYFARALISGSLKSDETRLKYAMALELNGEQEKAARNYIAFSSESTGSRFRTSIYRAVGCYQRLQDFDSIVSITKNLPATEWDGFSGMHEITGSAHMLYGHGLTGLQWLFSAPLKEFEKGSYQKTLNTILKNTKTALKEDDVLRLLLSLADTIFQTPSRAKKLIRFLIQKNHTEDLKSILSSPELVSASKGQCIYYYLNLCNNDRSQPYFRKWAKRCIILRPSDTQIFSYLVPEEKHLPEDGELDAESEQICKRVIISEQADASQVNQAIVALKAAGKSDQQRDYLLRAASRFPEYPIVQYNVGTFLNLGSLAELAEPILRRALLVDPGYAKALSAYSVSQSIMLETGTAIRAAQWAISSNPSLISAYTNLAMAHRGNGDLPSAISVAKTILEKEPGDTITRVGLAYNQICMGALEQGFENYLVRWAQKGFPSEKRPFKQREWKRDKIPSWGKIIVYMEQGMGDELMFSWFLNCIEELHPGQIILECDERLAPLFARSFPRIEVVPRVAPMHERLSRKDVIRKVPIGHLPYYFTNELRRLIKARWQLALEPVVSGYGWLKADAKRVDHWKRYLDDVGGSGKTIVGIAWRSANLARARRLQYVTPSELIESLPSGVFAVNLQYVYTDDEYEELVRLGADKGIEVHTVPGLDLKDDLDEVTNLCAALDALATPLTSTAFMGGSLGVPTFVFRSAASGDIWQQMATPHLPWLPSIRVAFRDPRDDWSGVQAQIRTWVSMISSGKAD